MTFSFTEQVEELQEIVSSGAREVGVWQKQYEEIKVVSDKYKV
jgi:hypothetical protein